MSYRHEDYFSWSKVLLYAVILLLSCFGLFYIYSSGYIAADLPVRENWQKQLSFLVFGFAIFFFLSRWDNRSFSWRFFIATAYILSLLALILVLLIGKEVGGARRWLKLGSFFMQPSESGKIFTILAFCLLLEYKKRFSLIPFLLLSGLLLFLPAFLIKKEPALGNALLIFPPVVAVIAVRYFNPKIFLALTIFSFLIIITAIISLFYFRSGQIQLVMKNPEQNIEVNKQPMFFRMYHLRRLQSYISEEGGWNEQQALMAVAGGGIKGKGYKNGTMKKLGYLPRTVAPTDFIFAVIAEEGGLLFGSIPVIVLYTLLIVICLYWAASADNQLDQSLCVAYATLILLHVLIAIGMSIRLTPIIGLPLPLLSYGGSFTVNFLAGLACIAGTRIHRKIEKPKKDKNIVQIKLGRILSFKITRD